MFMTIIIIDRRSPFDDVPETGDDPWWVVDPDLTVGFTAEVTIQQETQLQQQLVTNCIKCEAGVLTKNFQMVGNFDGWISWYLTNVGTRVVGMDSCNL